MFLKGIPNSFNNSYASSLVVAEVTKVISKPVILFTLSISISGKMMCSLIPKLKFPRPSKPLGLIPLKSRVLGSETERKRSRKSYSNLQGDKAEKHCNQGYIGGCAEAHFQQIIFAKTILVR